MTLWIPSDVLAKMMRETALERPTAKELATLTNHPMRQLFNELMPDNGPETRMMSQALNLIIRTIEMKICNRMQPGLHVLATETMDGVMQPINRCVPVCIHADRDNRPEAILEPPTLTQKDNRWKITFHQAQDTDLWEQFVETRPAIRAEYDWAVEINI